MPRPNVFIGRQPIVDVQERVEGYEILYRSGAESRAADFEDQDQAATEVVVSTFMKLGPDAVFGAGKGFFNATWGVLERGLLEVLPPDRVVIELLEDIEPDNRLIKACERLRGLGFTLALDDYVPNDPREGIVELVDWVKVDLLATEPSKLRGVVRKLRPTGVHLLAEKVDTREAFDKCLSLGFESFQGFFFARPEILSGCAPSSQNSALLNLMARLQAGDDTHEIAEALKLHADLSVGMLRIANSAAHARSQNLSRIEDALIFLGRKQLQRWLAILLFSQNRPAGHRDPLLVLAAKRGRLLERLAGGLKDDADWTERAFLVGLLASVEALLARPKEEVLEDLRLDEESRAALLGHEGQLGGLLRMAEAAERCNFEEVEVGLEEFGISHGDFQAAENDSYVWAHELSAGLAA